MLESLDQSLIHFLKWSLFFGVIYFSYKSRDFRIFGWLVGGIIVAAAFYRAIFTVLPSDIYWFFGLSIIASCFLGRKNDWGKPD